MQKIIIVKHNGRIMEAVTEQRFREHRFYLDLINKTTIPAFVETGKSMKYYFDNHASLSHIVDCEWERVPDGPSQENSVFDMFGGAEPDTAVYTFEITYLKD